MTALRLRVPKSVASAALVVAGLALGGCGGTDGVELNGKIFEALGVSGDNAFGKKTEPKTQARAPLVLPPDPNRLPEPGSASPVQTGSLQNNPAWPSDPEARRLADADAQKKAHEKFCKEDGNWKQKAVKDESGVEKSPGGSCSGSLFSVITDQLTGNKN